MWLIHFFFYLLIVFSLFFFTHLDKLNELRNSHYKDLGIFTSFKIYLTFIVINNFILFLYLIFIDSQSFFIDLAFLVSAFIYFIQRYVRKFMIKKGNELNKKKLVVYSYGINILFINLLLLYFHKLG